MTAEKKTTVVYDEPELVSVQLPIAYVIFGINSRQFSSGMQNSGAGTVRLTLEGDYVVFRAEGEKFFKIHAQGVMMTFKSKTVER